MLPLLLLACRETPETPPPSLSGTFSTQPNVLIIVWDTVRADRTSIHGGPAATTPHLAELAERSVVFEQAISPGFWTLPAHASLFTGLPVTAHGATWKTPWLDDAFVTQAEWFAQHGYATYAWSTNPNVHPFRNTTQGIETYHAPFGQADSTWRAPVLAATRERMHPEDASTPASPAWSGKSTVALNVAGPVVPEAFLGWLSDTRPAGQSYWAFINLMEVHDPRLPTEVARQTLLGEQVAASLTLNASPGRMRQATTGKRPYTDAQRAILQGVYDATLADLDAATGALLDALETAGALENTVVVITSDHGEQLGEHGLYRHNRTLYDTLVRVPLVIHHPTLSPRRVEEPVSTAQLFATLAEMTDLPMPQTPQVMRDSLLRPSGPVFTECTEPVGTPKSGDPEHLWRSSRAVVSDTWKLIESDDGTIELYDRSVDPLEQHSLAEAEPERVVSLSAQLSGWYSGLTPHTPAVPEAVPILEADGLYTDRSLSDEIHGALQALGYVE